MTPSLFAGALALLSLANDAGHRMGVDPFTILAIAHVESRGSAKVVRREHDGSCSVGAMGINVPACDPVDIDHLLSPVANVQAGAAILKAGKAHCAAHPENVACKRGGAVGLYNPGDPGYAKRVKAARRAILRAFHQKKGTRR